MNGDRRQEAVEYLLGEMEPADAARFRAEAESDAELRRMVDELRPVVSRLENLPPESWQNPEPPALVMPVGDTAPEVLVSPKSAGKVKRFGWPRLAAGFATACVLFGAGLFVGTRLEDQGTTSGPTETLALAGLGEAPPGASGEVHLARSENDAVTLDVSGLRPTGSGEFYELWLLGKHDELVALGTFRVRPDGASEVKVPLPVSPSDYRYFDVSIQEDNGSPDHSGRSVLRGLSTS